MLFEKKMKSIMRGLQLLMDYSSTALPANGQSRSKYRIITVCVSIFIIVSGLYKPIACGNKEQLTTEGEEFTEHKLVTESS